MAPKHTPGPWWLKGSGSIYGADGDLVATCGYRVSVGSIEDESNAALIAAATDLADALEELVAWVTSDRDGGYHCDREVTAARAALRKAGRIP